MARRSPRRHVHRDGEQDDRSTGRSGLCSTRVVGDHGTEHRRDRLTARYIEVGPQPGGPEIRLRFATWRTSVGSGAYWNEIAGVQRRLRDRHIRSFMFGKHFCQSWRRFSVAHWSRVGSVS